MAVRTCAGGSLRRDSGAEAATVRVARRSSGAEAATVQVADNDQPMSC